MSTLLPAGLKLSSPSISGLSRLTEVSVDEAAELPPDQLLAPGRGRTRANRSAS